MKKHDKLRRIGVRGSSTFQDQIRTGRRTPRSTGSSGKDKAISNDGSREEDKELTLCLTSQDDQQRWEQGGGRGAYPVINQPGESFNAPMSPGWLQASSDRNNSGLMLAMANSPAVNKMKNIYSQVDPFFPNVDPGDQQIGYDFNKNLWGGTLGFGGGYDIDDEDYNAYINWGTNW